jgi:hypothetical protein
VKRHPLSPPPFPGFSVIVHGGDGSPGEGPGVLIEAPKTEIHPGYAPRGIEYALGFIPHEGENRRTRLTGVAKWEPPAQKEDGPKIPTRRELWEQRQKYRRGTLDVELRRLQKRKAKK